MLKWGFSLLGAKYRGDSYPTIELRSREEFKWQRSQPALIVLLLFLAWVFISTEKGGLLLHGDVCLKSWAVSYLWHSLLLQVILGRAATK